MKGHVEEYFVQDNQGWRTNYYGNVLNGFRDKGWGVWQAMEGI